MAGHDVRDDIRAKLQAAIDDLRIQLARVEIWADALDGFSRPVPHYRPDARFVLRSRRCSEH